jgi:hypothetical protein
MGGNRHLQPSKNGRAQAEGIGKPQICLSEVNDICLDRQRDVHAIVDAQGNASLATRWAEGMGQMAQRRGGQVLGAQLETTGTRCQETLSVGEGGG